MALTLEQFKQEVTNEVLEKLGLTHIIETEVNAMFPDYTVAVVADEVLKQYEAESGIRLL